jgi:hypothetical protein
MGLTFFGFRGAINISSLRDYPKIDLKIDKNAPLPMSRQGQNIYSPPDTPNKKSRRDDIFECTINFSCGIESIDPVMI